METTLEVAVLGNQGSEDIFNVDMRVGALVMVKPLAPAKMASTTVEEYIILWFGEMQPLKKKMVNISPFVLTRGSFDCNFLGNSHTTCNETSYNTDNNDSPSQTMHVALDHRDHTTVYDVQFSGRLKASWGIDSQKNRR